MKGLEQSRCCWEQFGSRILSAAENLSPGLSGRLSAGLAGEGSQCFGFDDALSADHDFGPGFCLWMDDADFAVYGGPLQQVYDEVSAEFPGRNRQNLLAPERLGVMSVSGFFDGLTGCPETNTDWLFLSESALSCAVNGEVWLDGSTEFSRMRRRLLQYYPEDIRRKKIAARAAVIAQAGQYNLLRSLKRNDRIAAQLAAARFTEATVSMVHLLHRRYTPFYKWAFRSLEQIPGPLAAHTAKQLTGLSVLWASGCEDACRSALQLTEAAAAGISEELQRQNLSSCRSSFLQDHLRSIMDGIEDPQIRAMHPMADPAF